MDIENIPEIDKANLPKLEQYWTYLSSYRSKVNEMELVSSDMAHVFRSPLENE